MPTTGEKEQIRQLIGTPQWATVEALANQLCETIERDTVVGDSEWDTLKKALLDEGQVRGIRKFIAELYKEAQREPDTPNPS